MQANGYRRTGIFFSVIFLIGAILVVVLELIAGKPVITAITHPYFFICLVLAAAMLLSSRSAVLAWIQPLVYFIGFLFAVFSGSAPELYGMGFYIVTLLLLFRFGFFEKYRLPKIIVALCIFYVAEIVTGLASSKQLAHNLGSLFFITVLLLTLYFSYQEKLMVYLKEPKETLSLKSKGLTDAEQKYVLAMVGGKSPKEIAFFYEVSESTVRNTLARAYKKLGVGDRSELAALAARVELVA